METSTTDGQPDRDTMDTANSEKSKSRPTSPTPAEAKDTQDPSKAQTQPGDDGEDNTDSPFDGETPAFESVAPTPAPVQPQGQDDDDEDEDDEEPEAQSQPKQTSPAPETKTQAQPGNQSETQNENQQPAQPAQTSPAPDQRRPSTASSSDSDLSSIGPTLWKGPKNKPASDNGPPSGQPTTSSTANIAPSPSHPNPNNSVPPSHPNYNNTPHHGPPPGHQTGPHPGYQQGHQPGPHPGYQPGQQLGHQPGPHPGYQPNVQPRPVPSPHPNGIYGAYGQPPPDPGPKPMPPAPAVHGPFTYDKDGFKALGFRRETPYNLNMIMRDPNAAPPIEPVAKAWFHAQLIHYSIPVNTPPHSAEPLPNDLFYALNNALRTQTIREGKNPPGDILTIEDNLRRQFKAIYRQYKEAYSYWEQQTFARCATPTDEINCSLDLFMAKYFLKGVRGRPDPRKTRWPIILHKLNDYDGTRKVVKAVPGLRSHMMPLWSVICWEEYGIERAIEEAFASIAASHPSITIHVPTMEAHFHIDYFLSKYWLTGLYGRPMPMLTQEPITIEGWFGGPDIRNILTQAVLRVPDLRVWAFIGNGIDKTVIGWGDKPFQVIEHLRVSSMHQQAANTAPQRAEIQGSPTWELALRPHFHLCQVKADLLTANPQQAYQPFEIEELVGSWLIQCPALENGGWGGRPGEMTIDILNWPVDSYGLVASINLKVALGTMILARSERSLDDLSSYLLHDPELLPHIPHQKRCRGGAGDDFYVEYPTRRRSPYEPVPPLRIFFDWIGRRAGEFDVELDMDLANRNRGWVDIDMNNKVFGKGWLKYVKFFGKDNPVAFSMYKVLDQPRKMPEQWSNFRPKALTAQMREKQMGRVIARARSPRGGEGQQRQQQPPLNGTNNTPRIHPQYQEERQQQLQQQQQQQQHHPQASPTNQHQQPPSNQPQAQTQAPRVQPHPQVLHEAPPPGITPPPQPPQPPAPTGLARQEEGHLQPDGQQQQQQQQQQGEHGEQREKDGERTPQGQEQENGPEKEGQEDPKGKGKHPEKDAQEGESQEQQDEEVDGDEDEDDQEYGTPAEEAPPALSGKEQQTNSDKDQEKPMGQQADDDEDDWEDAEDGDGDGDEQEDGE